MTSIFELFERINNPVCLEKINWRMELRGFEVNRIASIIIGIEDDYVCEQVARIIEEVDYPEYISAPRCADYEKGDERILPYCQEVFKKAGLHNAKSVREAIEVSKGLRQKEKEKKEVLKRISEQTRLVCFPQTETAGPDTAQADKGAIPSDSKSVKNTRRTPGHLFEHKNGKKNEEETAKQARLFLAELEKKGISDIPLDTTSANLVNEAFVNFYRQCKKEGLLQKFPNGNACYRFLKEDCFREIKTTPRSYANFIRNKINNPD